MKNKLPILKLQEIIKKSDFDIFLINRTDEFMNEYISPYAERLCWVSNFSGSAGRALIKNNEAILFVDGRYTVQAKEQVDPETISISHLNNYWLELEKLINLKQKICVDPKLHSITEIKKIQGLNTNNNKQLFCTTNPIDKIWANQPIREFKNIFDHPVKYSGLDRKDKLKDIQKKIQEENIDYYFLSSLDSIAWILNIRGNDIEKTPLLFSYLLIPSIGKPIFFVSIENINKTLLANLKKIYDLKNLNEVENTFNTIKRNKKVGMDYDSTSYYFYELANKIQLNVKNIKNPCLFSKAIKNNTEVKGAKKANLRDGVSVCKFIYWIKNKTYLGEDTELSAANYLFDLRKNNELFHSLSFDTISAVGKNAALPHYRITNNKNDTLLNDSIYLIDSGAQYYDGTTDITRTVILGKPNNEQVDRFTRVLKGHIALSTHTFKRGTKGTEVDYVARVSLNEIGCDYDHGTGHGIGSFLSVHEGPQRISKKNMFEGVELKPGMILSNEPGYYKENEYGIRIENLIIVIEKDDDHLGFENISWSPIDIDLIDRKMLTNDELVWINSYHKKVYNKLNKFLNPKEKIWLKAVTKPL